MQSSSPIREELSSFQIEKTLLVTNEKVTSYNVDGYKEIILQVVKVVNPEFIITGHTYQARDFMPRLSASLDTPFIPDLVSIENSSYIKQIMNSKLNASIS